MQDEIRFHIEAYAEDLVRQGVTREEARRKARMEFGTVETQKEECRASLGLRMWDEFRGDLRYTLRVLRKSPGFTAVAITTLALGIGANTAIFTLVNALMLRLVPVHRPEELYQVKIKTPGRTAAQDGFTNPLWEQVRDRQEVFSGTAAWGSYTFNLGQGGAIRPALGIWVSGNFFETLEVRPAAGRLISPADDRRGCPSVAVLSYAFWQQHYGGTASAVGSTLSLDAHPFEVIGVAPPGFYGLDVGNNFDVAAPNCATALLDGERSRLDQRSWWWLAVVGRIKPGISPQQLNGRLAAVSPQVFAGALPQDWGADSQKGFLSRTLTAVPAGSGISYLRQQFQQPLKILMAVVGIVLLIACANVAALMLARAAAQTREMAVRLALGATRMRLVRQLLMHCVVLSIAGAAAGAVLAQWATALLVAYLSTRKNPVFLDLSPDWRVLTFTATTALLTGVLFGILPAFHSTRVPLTRAMRGSPSAHNEHRSPVRKWIVATQIALSLVLLVTAGLFLRSFAKLIWLDPGFDRQNVLLVSADLRSTTIKPEQHLATYDLIQSRLSALPGVVAVGRSVMTPLEGGGWNNIVHADTANPPKGDDALSLMNFITPGYFATLRMPLFAGRDFTPADNKTAAKVAIVNQAFARKFFPGMNPIGHVLRVDKANSEPGPPIEVVGVVGNAKYMSLREEMPETVFFPLPQITGPEYGDTYEIRSAVSPTSLRSAVVAAMAGVSREIPLEFTTLAKQVDDTLVQERLLAVLSAFFGVAAVVLATIGLFGTVSYRVTLRKAEFGIRMALGARVASIVRLVMGEVAAIVVIGVGAGLAISMIATRALQKLLFGLGAHDVATLAGASALLAAAALLAAFMLARRAAKVDPMVALRSE